MKYYDETTNSNNSSFDNYLNEYDSIGYSSTLSRALEFRSSML